MTTTTLPSTTARGLLLPCPLCGSKDAEILVSMANGEACRCVDCDDEFTIRDVRGMLAKWSKAIAWLETMPRG